MRIALHEHALGLSWTVEEPLRRASHALVHGGRVWLVDPVDAPEARAPVAALGEPAAVLQLLDRHNRDCEAMATRLGVPHETVPKLVPGSPFEVLSPVDVPRWRERTLWWPEHEALVVAEAIGTGPLYTVGTGAAGMHPMLRPRPPRRLRPFRPRHLLVGHGAPLHGAEAASGLEHAYARARRDLPRLVTRLPRLVRG